MTSYNRYDRVLRIEQARQAIRDGRFEQARSLMFEPEEIRSMDRMLARDMWNWSRVEVGLRVEILDWFAARGPNWWSPRDPLRPIWCRDVTAEPPERRPKRTPK